MELGNIIIEGGLTNQKYDDQQELKSARAAQNRERGLRAQQIAAEEGLMPFKTENELARLRGTRKDLMFDERTRGSRETLVEGALKGSVGRQSTEESIKDINAEIERSKAEWQRANQSMQEETATLGMNTQNIQAKQTLDQLKLQQTLLLYKKLKLAGPKAILEDINNNDLILGNVQYKDIYMTKKDETGADRPVKDSEEADTIMLVNPDDSVTPIPMEQLKKMADDQGGRSYQTYKEGEAVYQTDADGKMTLVGSIPKSFAPVREWYDNSETGGLYNAFTGESKGGVGAGSNGLTMKQQKHIDSRVSMADDLVRGYLWQSSQFAQMDEATQKAYGRMMGQIVGPLVRNGMDPEQALDIAVVQFEKKAALDGVLGSGDSNQPSPAAMAIINGMGGQNR